MGNKQSINKINFEDVQYIQKHNKNVLIINTLADNEQECLIKGTIDPINEVKIINNLLSRPDATIIIYGKNCNDNTMTAKYNSLYNLGFSKVYIYMGGLFEWLCLQDIYGDEMFPTTTKELDILKFKPDSVFNALLITDID